MRTFIAFTLPDEVANQIIEWQQQNLPEGVHPEPVTNLHMTLAFLGDTPDELVPHINEILSRLDASQVVIDGPIAYEEKEKLAFLTYNERGGSEVWEQLNAELKTLMGYEPQFRPWLPHTTVWRFAPENKPNLNPPLPSLSFSPTAVTLYQSVRNPGGGATYQHVSSDETWDEFNKSDPDQSAAFMRRLEDIPGVRRLNPIKNNDEVIFKPGDRVVHEHTDGSAGVVLKAYPPGTPRTQEYLDWMEVSPDEVPWGLPANNWTYDVQWDHKLNYKIWEWESPGEIGSMVDGTRLWPEGDVRLDMAYSKWKKESRTTMYHVTAAQNRTSIQQNGLKAMRKDAPSSWPDMPSGAPRPDGVYLWDSMENAELYAKRQKIFSDPEFWGVDATGLNLRRDPYFVFNNPGADWKGPHGAIGAFATLDDIPPDRMWLEWANPWFPLEDESLYNPRKRPEPFDEYESRTSNIFDPIEQTLDQAIFKGIEPRPTILQFIERMYYRALDQGLGVQGDQYADLYFTGSLTTYQYSSTSDADISVFPDYDLIYQELGLDDREARQKLISLSIDHLDGTFLPGTTHPLQFFVVPKGTLPGDLYQPGLRSAYSFDDRTWFQEPEKFRVHDVSVEYPELYARAAAMADKMSQMLDAGDDEAADQLWKDIHKKRQLDQRAGLGDFSEGNIVYKWFLHQGLFDRIRNELHEYIAKWSIFIDPEDAYFEDAEDNPIRMHEYWRTFWIDPKEMFQENGKMFVCVLTNDKEVDAGEHVVVKWESPNGRQQADGVLVYRPDSQMMDEAWQKGLPESEWSSLIEIQPDSVRPIVYASVKWSMPPAEEWDQFALDIEDRQHDNQFGKVDFINDTGVRWRYDHSTLANVAHLLGTPITFNVSRRWFEGYGQLHYQYTTDGAFNFTITLNKSLSPEAAAYSLWHEIQHAFQLVEKRAELGSGTNLPITRDTFDQYVTDPSEIDADAMAAKMHLIEDLPVVQEIPITEGAEKDYYDELISEGWPQNEALDMLIDEGDEITLQEVIKNRQALSATDLWEDRVTTKVIYDFDNDKILLGTQATQAAIPDSKIIGDYEDGIVVLYDADKQWINPTYFRRLWHFSYPQKDLKDVYYKRGEDKVKLKTVRRRGAYVHPVDEQFGMGLVRDKTYAVIWKENLPAQICTWKGIYAAHGEPLYSTFWINGDYRKKNQIVYDHFVWMMENNMIVPIDRDDTLNYLPWSEEEQDYYRTSGWDEERQKMLRDYEEKRRQQLRDYEIRRRQQLRDYEERRQQTLRDYQQRYQQPPRQQPTPQAPSQLDPRLKIIDKILKLQAQAAGTTFAPEAETALTMAKRLMDQNGITQAELDQYGARYSMWLRIAQGKWAIVSAIVDPFTCHVCGSTNVSSINNHTEIVCHHCGAVWPYEDNEREEKDPPAPKFYDGDSVIMKAYGESGSIKGEPHWSQNEWWYYVNTYDSEGPKGLTQYPESDMERPSRYDQPGEMTIKDMFGITPEGEDYYRTAAIGTMRDNLVHYPLAVQAYIEVLEQNAASADRVQAAAVNAAQEVLVRTYQLNPQWGYVYARTMMRLYEEQGLEALHAIVNRPPAPTDEFADAMWPETIPWGEAEQDYYRTSSVDVGSLWYDTINSTTYVVETSDEETILLRAADDYKHDESNWSEPFQSLMDTSYHEIDPVSFEQAIIEGEFIQVGDFAQWKMAASTDFVDFFDQASRGQYAPQTYLNPSFDNPDHQMFYDTHKQFAGNFDQHIETSIPGYRELQVKKGTAITQAFPGASVLDIGGSEGSWAKAVSAIGGNRTVNLEPNAAMVEHYFKNPVEGAEIAPYAFLEGFEHNGDQYPRFDPGETYDIVNESMTFQFISPNRAEHIMEVKRLLSDGGLFLTDEKVVNDNWDENERVKDAWKSQFYSEQQQAEKQKVVNYNDDESAVGMVSNMVHHNDLESALESQFSVVHQYWSSGNFVGYACSDNRDTVNAFLEAFHA
jgi:2'-5' RNA ligase